MRFVPKAELTHWRTKALDAAQHADLGSAIELLLETKETERLVHRIQEASNGALEGLSHYTTEPAAKRLWKTHPDIAAKLFRAMGKRIVNAGKSKYYDAALSNFEEAKSCYVRAGIGTGMGTPGGETSARYTTASMALSGASRRLVAVRGPSKEPSFLARARSRWLPQGS
jgi:hypothetical protein